MPEIKLNEQQKKSIEGYLKGYSLNKKMLRIQRYEKQFFSEIYEERREDMPKEEPLAKARMFDVRHFILSLDNSDEKLFLYFHYIKDYSVSRCAELLGISERAGFRMKNRALFVAYEKKYCKEKEN